MSEVVDSINACASKIEFTYSENRAESANNLGDVCWKIEKAVEKRLIRPRGVFNISSPLGLSTLIRASASVSKGDVVLYIRLVDGFSLNSALLSFLVASGSIFCYNRLSDSIGETIVRGVVEIYVISPEILDAFL